MNSPRLYHVVCIRLRNGSKTYLSADPMPHEEACVMLSKSTRHPLVRVQLEEVGPNTLLDRLTDLFEITEDEETAILLGEAMAFLSSPKENGFRPGLVQDLLDLSKEVQGSAWISKLISDVANAMEAHDRLKA